MKVSKLLLEPSIVEAYLHHLKATGYVVTHNLDKLQPFFVHHTETPDLTHILELHNDRKSLVIPEKLHTVTMAFYDQIADERKVKLCS